MKPSYYTLALVILILCQCSQSGQKQTTVSEEEARPVTKASATDNIRSGTALSGMFKVQDVAKWQAVFNGEVSKSAQIGMMQNLDDPKLVFNMIWTNTHAEGREIMTSARTENLLNEGTISSEPDFTLYNINYYNADRLTDSLRLAITFEVINYEMWKGDFDRDESSRQEAGLKLIGMASSAENKNKIYLLFGTNDKQTAYDFVSSPGMESALSEAGVIGEPNMSWWRVIN